MMCFMRQCSARKKRVRNGFTLLEMLIVVSIIMVLATIAIPKFSSAGKTAKIAKIQADIHTAVSYTHLTLPTNREV